MAERDPNDWQEAKSAPGAGDWEDGDDWAAPTEESLDGANGEPPKSAEQHRWRRLIVVMLGVAGIGGLVVLALATLAFVAVLKQSRRTRTRSRS